MIIIFKAEAALEQVKAVEEKVKEAGLKVVPLPSQGRQVLAVVGDDSILDRETIRAIEGVDKITEVSKPYKLASRESKPEGTVIDIDGVKFGGDDVVVVSGPCSIESEEQLIRIAKSIKQLGVHVLRGGAFKWRTSPHSFQGMGLEGLRILRKAKEITGLPTITEVLDPRQVEAASGYCDILQIGTVSMQNYPLLKEVGKSGTPVMLKRGKWATYTEFLLAAEYIMAEGNPNVILCERGIRTFVGDTRHTMDINAIPYLKEITHLPIVADPSHSTGIAKLVSPISLASIAAGADGLIIESHYDPKNALTDAAQTISMETLEDLMGKVRLVAKAVGRTM